MSYGQQTRFNNLKGKTNMAKVLQIGIDEELVNDNPRLLEKIEDITFVLTKQSHQFVNHKSFYEENDIETLIPDYVNRWPTPPSILNFDASSPSEYYTDMLQSMIHSYVHHAISTGDILSYDDVRKNCPNHFDLYSNTNKYLPDEEKEKDKIYDFRTSTTIKEQNWKTFLPKDDVLSVRINKNRYMYIKVLKRNTKTKSAELEISLYQGNRTEWIIINRIKINITFCPQKNKIGLEWELKDLMSYEMFLTKYLNEMNWSKKQINLWQDAFNAYPLDELKIFTMAFADDVESNLPKTTLLISGKDDQNTIRKNTNEIMRLQHESTNEEAIQQMYDSTEQKLFIAYIKTITIVNIFDELVANWQKSENTQK